MLIKTSFFLQLKETVNKKQLYPCPRKGNIEEKRWNMGNSPRAGGKSD